MVAFIIFWSAILVIIFFVLEIIFKALSSAFNSLLVSLAKVLAIGFSIGVIEIVLILLGGLISEIVTKGFLSVLGTVVIYVLILVLAFAVGGGITIAVIQLVMTVVLYILGIIGAILELLAELCEKAYAKSLQAIVSRIDKC